MNLIGFIVFSALAVISAVVVVWRTNPVVSALALAFNLVSIAGIYLLLHTQFVALLQVIVYAGAIMVMVLFVIMLLNQPLRKHRPTGFVQLWLGPALALVFTVVLGWALWAPASGRTFATPADDFGTIGSVGRTLFTNFFYAFEAISLLLVVAMIGAVVLAKKEV